MKRLLVTVVVTVAVAATSRGFAQAQPLVEPSQLAQLVPGERTVELGVGTLVTDGDGRRLRELARTPGWLWGTARAFVPIESQALWGRLQLEATTLGTGRLWLDVRLPDGSRLQVAASRHRFPHASVARTAAPPPDEDAGALDRLEQVRERLELRWRRDLELLDGRVEATADVQRLGGTQPSLAAGLVSPSPLNPAFGSPSYRRTDDFTGGATAGYSVAPRHLRFGIAGSARFDSIDDRLLLRDGAGGPATGFADLHDTARARSLELVATAASDRPAPLMVGGSYRLTQTVTTPNVEHTTAGSGGSNGTVRSNDAEIRSLRQHGSAGLVWQPWYGLRLAGRLDARLTDLDTNASQARDLGTPQIVRVDSRRDNWSLDGRMEGRVALRSAATVELDARGGLRRGDDDWSLRYLLADGTTPAGERARALDRHLLTGRAELRLVTRPLAGLRATVGTQVEGLRSDQDVKRWVDAFQLGDRSRTRAGGFVAARSRLLRRLALDGRASFLRETWTSSAGGKDTHWRFDVRLRLTATAGPLTVFGLGSLTQDRHDLSGGETQPGFASLDFLGRSWLGLAGASATLGRFGWASATYTLVANTRDLDTRLHDAAVAAGTALPWRKLRLQLTGRYLDFREGGHAARDGKAALVLLTLAGAF